MRYLFIILIFFGCNKKNGNIDSILDEVNSIYAPDKRVSLFNITYSLSNSTIIIDGETTKIEAKNYLLQKLDSTGINYSKAKIDDKVFSRGKQKVVYSHISQQTRFPKSDVSLIKFDLNIKAKNIAYLMGSGDKIPESLSLVGYNVDIIGKKDLNIENLKNYDALIVGVRAFNFDKSLLDIKPDLMNYMDYGGNVIIQYNTSRNLDVNKFSPHPFNLSRNRVSQEDAPVRIINKKHPALNYPNKINLEDFNGWVQERGLYFPNSWSPEYETIISSNDEGEKPNNGGILISKVGEGYFIYTTYSWFRQLPAGVSGAYKIFSNLISLGKK